MANELQKSNGNSNSSVKENGSTEKENPSTWKDLTFIQRIKYIINYISVEPVLACYVLPSVLASLAVQNLNLEKACRVNMNYTQEVCDNLIHQSNKNKTMEELEVQALVAYMGAWRLPLQSVLPAITILFVGAWSDRTRKRKPYMLIPMLGEFLTAFGLILCTYYFLEWPLEVAGVIEGLPPALTGGWAMMFMAIFSYIADHTPTEERTFRIGLVNMFISIAVPIGTALSGILLNKLGFYGVFSVCLVIYIVGFLYGFLGIKDKKREKEDIVAGSENCAAFFNLRNVLDTFMVLFKRRKLNKRTRTLLLMLIYILVSGPVHGSGQLIYLYARLKFKFTEVDFSIFSAYSIVMNLVGVLTGISLFSKYLKMDDSLIGFMACISKVLASIVFAFAPSIPWLYLGPLVEVIGGTAVICMRSIATKVVEPDEIGKINSIFGVCDALVNVIYPPIFAKFYVATFETFAGAYCLLGALLTSPTIGIFLYMYILQKRDTANEKVSEEKKAAENLAFENEVTSL